MTTYQHIVVPAEGQKITVNADMSLNVPDEPITVSYTHLTLPTIYSV